MNNSPAEKYIDTTIFIFMVIFIGSLTNSIFINQIGYFGTLLILILKFAVNKRNPFGKTGLELAFILFLLAEGLSTLFSVEVSHSFQNMLKRLLLIPVVYVTAASSFDLKRSKKYFYVFIGFALFSFIIYLVYSAQHFFYNLYGIKQSGPGVFHYPITTSEIMSFVVVILFSFLINEKGNWKYRLFILISFLISAAALFATYKRTGWIGAAAGILLVIILSRKWLLLLPIIIGVVLLFVIDKQRSEFHIYNLEANKLSLKEVVETGGRAYYVYPDNDKLILSDYENGIVEYKGNGITNRIEMPAPVNKTIRINDTAYISLLNDTRVFIYKTEGKNSVILNEHISPGYSYSYSFTHNELFILDTDSGLTVFPDFIDKKERQRYPTLNRFKGMYVDSSSLILFSPGNGIEIFKFADGLIDTTAPLAVINTNADYLDYYNGFFLEGDGNSLKVSRLQGDRLIKINVYNEIKRLYTSAKTDSLLYLTNTNGELFCFADRGAALELLFKQQLQSVPFSISAKGGQLFATFIQQSRIKSIFDPNNQNNQVRFALWSAAIKIVRDFPLFGVGDIDLADYYIEYKNYYDKEIQGHMHNNFFHILATLGLFGFAAFLFLLIKIYHVNIKIHKAVKGIPFKYSYSLGVLGAFTAFIFAGLTEWNFGDHEIITMIWFLIGLNFALFKSQEQ